MDFLVGPDGKETFLFEGAEEHRLLVELDGRVHFFQREYDVERTDILEGMGLHVVRFQNEELAANFDGVLERLKKILAGHPNSPRSPSLKLERGV